MSDDLKAPSDPAQESTVAGNQPLPTVDDLVSPGDGPLAPGATVGEYVVAEKIGEGGFGTVFRAIQPLIGKEVAIKVLKRQFCADREIVSRFVAEARAVNQIGHKHIIDIFSFGKLTDGRQYYVMTYLRGGSLAELLASRPGRRLGLEEARPILRAIADALDAAHQAGIAHRDLKPANVFLEHDGAVKLLDFGVAKLMTEKAEHRTETGAPIGTPHYMSPEQARGRAVDHRTDVYAFGVVAFQVLTGQLPFKGQSVVDIALQHVHDPPPPPSRALPGLSPEIDRAILWMLEKTPEARPQRAFEAMRALESAMGFEVPEGALLPPTTARRRKPLDLEGHSRSARRRWAAIGGLAVVAAIAAALWVMRDRGAHEPAGEPAIAERDRAPATPAPPAMPAPAPVPHGGPIADVELVTLVIKPDPSDAEVWFDGVVTIRREMTLARDDTVHTVEVRKPGYVTEQKDFVTRTAGPHNLLHLKLAREPSAVRPRRDPVKPPTTPPTPAVEQPGTGSAIDPTPRKPPRGGRNTQL